MPNTGNKKRNRAIAIIIVIIIIALLIVFRPKPVVITTSQASGTKSIVLVVNMAIAKTEKLTNTYYTSGNVMANESVDLRNEVPGRVVQILFTEGASVKKGQLLLKINDDDLQAQLKKAQSAEVTADADEERAKKLLQINGISQQDYDNALNVLNGDKADVENLQAAIEKTEIRAPFDGKVGLRNISVGSFLAAGTDITTLQQTNPIKIDFTIPAKYASELTNDAVINFTVDGVRDTFTAKTYAAEPLINANTGTEELRATCPNPYGKLIPGAFAHIIINLRTIDDAIMIPSQALTPKQDLEFLYVVKNGKAQMQKVTIGVRTDSTVQITSGLATGDSVITSSILAVKIGAPVKYSGNPTNQ